MNIKDILTAQKMKIYFYWVMKPQYGSPWVRGNRGIHPIPERHHLK